MTKQRQFNFPRCDAGISEGRSRCFLKFSSHIVGFLRNDAHVTYSVSQQICFEFLSFELVRAGKFDNVLSLKPKENPKHPAVFRPNQARFDAVLLKGATLAPLICLSFAASVFL